MCLKKGVVFFSVPRARRRKRSTGSQPQPPLYARLSRRRNTEACAAVDAGVGQSCTRLDELQNAASALERWQGFPLGPDQVALCEFLAARTKASPPIAPSTFRVPGATLSATQVASETAYLEGVGRFRPTAAAATAEARAALRRLKETTTKSGASSPATAQAAAELEELRELKKAAGALAASPRDPATMARASGYPGLEAQPRWEPPPFSPAPADHVPKINIPALAAMHVEVCRECSSGEDCFFWGFAKILSAVHIAWKKDTPPDADKTADRTPRADPELQAAVELWAKKGVAERCTRDDVNIPAHAFMAAAQRTPLSPEATEEIAAGGEKAAACLRSEAERRAQAAWAAYKAVLSEAEAQSSSRISSRQVEAAWKTAAPAMGGSPKLRLVVAPHAVNDNAFSGHFAYEEFADFMNELEPGWALAKSDIESFFYNVEIAAAAKGYFAFPVLWVHGDGTTEVQWWRLTRLPMGYCAAPFLASLLSAILMAILRGRVAKHGVAKGVPRAATCIFVDDGLFGAPARDQCGALLTMYNEVLETAGLRRAADKSTRIEADGTAGSTKEDMLGFAVDTAPLSITLPPNKLVKTAATLRLLELAAGGKVPIPRYLLASGAGLTTRLLQVAPHLAPRTREVVSTLYAKHGVERWNDEAKRTATAKELSYLLRGAAAGEWGAQPILRVHDPQRTLPVMTDATGAGCVAVAIPGVAACVFKITGTEALEVPELELLGPVLTLVRYGPLLNGWTLHHALDATGVAYWLWRNRATSAVANDLLAASTVLSAKSGCKVRTAWLSRWANWLADRLATNGATEALRAEGVPVPEATARVKIRDPVALVMAAASLERWSTPAGPK